MRMPEENALLDRRRIARRYEQTREEGTLRPVFRKYAREYLRTRAYCLETRIRRDYDCDFSPQFESRRSVFPSRRNVRSCRAFVARIYDDSPHPWSDRP